jgi:hypothetical protein
MQTKIEENRLSVDAVETKFTEWAREEKATAQSRMEGQGRSEGSAGSCRFGRCCAKAMSAFASSAVDKAAKAALEALLAHYDVEVSKLKQ